MSFDLKISLDDGGAVDTLAKVTGGMQGAETAAAKTTTAMAGVGTAAEQAGEKTSGATGRMAEALERVSATARKWGKSVEDYLAGSSSMDQKVLQQLDAAKANLGKLFPEAEMKAQIISLDRLLVQGRIGVEQYDAQIVKLQIALGKATGGTAVSEELERQAAVLERIKGPMRSYNADVAALEKLLTQGKVSAAEFDAELDRLNRKAGVVYGPAAPGPGAAKKPAGASAKDEDSGAFGDVAQSIGQHLGPAGQVLGAALSAGALGAAAMTAGAIGLGVELAHLDDRYTMLVQKITRFTESGQSANEIITQQFQLSKELHADLDATVGLYSRVRESTEELNLSERQQVQLTREIGEAVVGSGRGIESAEALTRRLSLAFSSGAISGRELRSIMKEYPEIATGFADALGHSRQELIAMANKGEISAQQIIGAFNKMAPAMEARMKAMPETIGQTLGHVKDAFMVGWNDLAESTVDPVTKMRARLARGALQEAASVKQLNTELEKNARLATIVNAAQSVGLSVGGFDLDAANKISEVRIAARAAGLDIADAFEGAKSKAQLYSTEIDKIKDSNAAKQIADDAKRIYEALYGVDDAMKKQFDHWRDMADEVTLITKQIERWKGLTPAGVPTSQEQRDLERRKRDIETDQGLSGSYGKGIVDYQKNLSHARDGLEDLRRAAAAGKITQEELRRKTDEFLTTLNDGRLPSAIKLWESWTLPLRDVSDDIAGLNALFRAGRVDVDRYNTELAKITARVPVEGYDTLSAGGAGRNLIGPRRIGGQDVAVGYERGPGVPGSGLSPAVTQGMTAATRDQTTAERLLNEQLERSAKLAEQFEAPAVTYKHALEDIDVAARDYGLTQAQTNFLQHKAREEFDASTEALQRAKGPLGQYEATILKLNHQLGDGAISQKKYAESVDAARIAFLQASGAAGTFSGAMEIEWLKMKADADNFGASVAKLVVDDFGKLNDAIVTAANGGAVAWGQMADAMIQDLERIALKMLEVKAISAVIGAFSGGGAEGAAISAALSSDGIVHAATGFDGVVGGSGGTDSKLFASMVTPGERVTITPPGAYPMPGGGGSGGASAAARPTVVQNHIHNHYDKSIGIAAIDSPGGNRSVLNVLRANQGAVRSYSGTRR